MEKKEIIYGRNPVYEQLKSGVSSESRVYISEGAHGKIIDLIMSTAEKKGIPVEKRPKPFFKNFDSSSRHQGVVLETTSGIKKNAGEKDSLRRIKEKQGVVVLLDHITDPRNAGSIIRSAEALGADAVALTEVRSAPLSPAAVKTSAGAVSHIEIINIKNTRAFLEKAKDEGFWIIGASEKGTDPLSKIKEYRPCVIIIGSEGTGMKKLAAEKCDLIVSIPMKGKISSLNASVAAGIIIYSALSDS